MLRSWIAASLFALSCVRACAQVGSIEATWVYSTPVTWERIGNGWRADERYSSTTIVVLYPEGQYLEVSSSLYRIGSEPVSIPGTEGIVIRTGTWSRTDDRAIRIQSREVMRDKILRASNCGKGVACAPPEDKVVTENCALEGESKTRLAQVIHCRRISVSPFTLPIDGSLEDRAREGFHAASFLR